MTREKVAEKLRWKLWTKVAGLLNAFLMAPQLAKIMSTGHSAGVSFGILAGGRHSGLLFNSRVLYPGPTRFRAMESRQLLQ